MRIQKHTALVEEIADYCPPFRNESSLKIAMITNHPPPFRIPVYERIGRMPGIDLQVIFCSMREPNREWMLPPLNFKHVFLRERFVTRGDNFIHNNLDVISTLKRLAPDVIVTTGFNPTFLYAFLYAQVKGIHHVPMTDGTDLSEQALSRWHKAVRHIVYARSSAFISASQGGKRLYESYGIDLERCFQSCLCIDNTAYYNAWSHIASPYKKQFDFIFCGRIVQDKNPLFALRVAENVAHRLRRKTSILFVGSGPEEENVMAEAVSKSALVDVEFNGFAAQHELPALYRSARLFLFPTLHDVWGVVTNEACAAKLPIIVSPHAGVAHELVLDGKNGFVCPLDIDVWGERAALLLSHEVVYQRFSRRSAALVDKYTFDQAAAGIVAACRYATGQNTQEKLPMKENRKVG